jgi:hypothetical protein
LRCERPSSSGTSTIKGWHLPSMLAGRWKPQDVRSRSIHSRSTALIHNSSSTHFEPRTSEGIRKIQRNETARTP